MSEVALQHASPDVTCGRGRRDAGGAGAAPEILMLGCLAGEASQLYDVPANLYLARPIQESFAPKKQRPPRTLQ